MNRYAYSDLPLLALTVSLLAISFPVQAAEEEDEDWEYNSLILPTSTVSIGGIYVSDDNTRFGQYRGLTDDGVYGALDFDINRRDEETGTWIMLDGRNLGLDSRELRFEHQRQGDWRYFLEYDAIPRVEPYTVNTGQTGIGTNNLTINGTALRDVDLETKRKAITLGGRKELKGGWAFETRFRNEEKDGERLFARGGFGGPTGTFEFLAEPIDSTTRQGEAILSYTGKALQLAIGYYGTHYDNSDTALNVTTVPGPLSSVTPIALAPDNQSHQGYVSGSYKFSPATVGNFKLAYGRATQDDSFIAPATPGNGDLDGRIDTTQVALGLRSRPLPDLTLRANFRYEDRDDKTPVRVYLTGGGTTTDGQNEPRSITTTAGKLEASYLLPRDFRLTGSVDYEEKERNETPIRVVSHRDTTDELTYRAELRRGLSETLNGALSVSHSKRDGSAFETTVLTTSAPYSNEIAPIHLADRDRDQVRLVLDWVPADPLSVQFVADASWDDYDQRTVNRLGPLEGNAYHFTADAAYDFSENVQGTIWYSHDVNEAEQATDDGGRWEARLRDTSDAVGVGLQARPHDKLEVGVDLTYADYESEFDQVSGVIATPAIPDVDYQLTTVNLFTKFRIKKNSGYRLDYIYEHMKTSDWSWTGWTYTDGTTLREDPRQTVHFVGLSYYYKF